MTILFKRVLLLLLLAVLLVPVLQARFHFAEEKTLYGAFTVEPHPDFTWPSLRNNEFQPRLERYLEDRIGFRAGLIRLRNQISYSLFRAVRSSDLLVGDHDVLFQPGPPLEAYQGHNLLPEHEVRFRVARLRAVQRALAQRGIQLVLVLAPGKARFQPEDLPAPLRVAPGTPTNYDRFSRALRADSVAFLDLTPVFAGWKKTRPHPLFPSTGTHWSGYGATLAADTLLRYLERAGHLRFPTVREVGPPRLVHAADSMRGTDNDLGQTLNLLWKLRVEPLAYRRLVFDPPRPGQTRPSALFVGDSFTWGLMLFSPYMQREFADDTRFWFYNNSVNLPDSVYHDTGTTASSLDLKAQLETRRFVVLLLTEHNLTENEFGFTERVYHLYRPLMAADEAAIDSMARKTASQATWEEQTKDPNFGQYNRQRAHDWYDRQQLMAELAHSPAKSATKKASN